MQKKVKEQFELMMTLLKRIIPKWERSDQGDGGHHGIDDDDNPLKDKDDINSILCNFSSSSEESNEEAVKEKPRFGVLVGLLSFALSKIQDFFENNNSFIIYLWHMIDNHQLTKSSMNMLADAVVAHSGAMGIPSAITTKRKGDDSSMLSKSMRSSSFSGATNEKDEGYTLSHRIMEHAARLCKLRDHTTLKDKCRRFDAIQLEIGRLGAEKRRLLIQQLSIPPGTNANLEKSLLMLISEVDEEIYCNTQRLSDVDNVDMFTPQKSNKFPK
jgi:hypothetical protein